MLIRHCDKKIQAFIYVSMHGVARRKLRRWDGYSLNAFLNHLTTNHSPLSGRSTLLYLEKDNSNILALNACFSAHFTQGLSHLLINAVSPTVAIPHLPPRIAIIFSSLPSVSGNFMSHSFTSYIFPSHTPCSSLFISDSPVPPSLTIRVLLSIALLQEQICASTTRLWATSVCSFRRARSPTWNRIK